MPKLNGDIENLAFLAPDLRSDGGVRRIRLTRDVIYIARAFAGIEMRLAIPVAAYRGVVLACEQKLKQNVFRITLAHRDPDLCVTLHQAAEMATLLHVWRDWARFFSKPAFLTREETFDPSKTGAHARRRGASLAQRRPRVLSRRRPGCRVSKVIHPIRELFSRE